MTWVPRANAAGPKKWPARFGAGGISGSKRLEGLMLAPEEAQPLVD